MYDYKQTETGTVKKQRYGGPIRREMVATNLRGGAGGDGGGEGDGIASRSAVAARKRRERSTEME